MRGDDEVAGRLVAEQGIRGMGGPATIALLKGPGGVAVDSAGNLYIADIVNYRVRKVSPSGIMNNGESQYAEWELSELDM